jgi:hypothetical protein
MKDIEFKPGQKWTLLHEPSFSTGGRKGTEVEVVDKGTYLAFKDKLGVTFPVHAWLVTDTP